jgi:hypothetical protein
MRILINPRFVLVGLGVAALTWGVPAYAANYPLELTNIKPAGAGGISASARIYRAYPGLEYNIRAAVIGGSYPYTFVLSDAPAGMTIDGRGVISWPSPQQDATPTITVRDTDGTQVASTWTIRVTTAGFRFLSAVNGRPAPTGAGTLDNPWRSMADVYYNSSATEIIYFRTGIYDQLSLPRSNVGDVWERVDWESSEGRPVIWLGYPGETPIIDFAYRAGIENAPAIRLLTSDAPPFYIDGFETTNTRIIGFQTYSSGTFRRMKMHGIAVGGAGTNAAFIMTLGGVVREGMVVQDCEFFGIPDSVSAVTIKIYSQHKLLIEDTVHHDAPVGVELKNSASQYTVRGNRFYNISGQSLGGNMQASNATTYGEICFNNIHGTAIALVVNQNSEAGITHIYRNTLVGRASMWNVLAANGPFYLTANVIVNSDTGTPVGSHVYHDHVSAPERVILSNNLVGYAADGIVDGAGRLTSAYSQFVGSRGYQVAPRAPSGVVIIR